ncbi:hypothetical protein [Andreprevotia chitinilytica]|nr:hypothetical protein [Andreprevotia chitinilytica]
MLLSRMPVTTRVDVGLNTQHNGVLTETVLSRAIDAMYVAKRA